MQRFRNRIICRSSCRRLTLIAMRAEKTRQFQQKKPWYVARWQGGHGKMGISFLGDVAFLGDLFAFCGIVLWLGRSHGLFIAFDWKYMHILGRLDLAVMIWSTVPLEVSNFCASFSIYQTSIGWCDVELKIASLILDHPCKPWGGLELVGKIYPQEKRDPALPFPIQFPTHPTGIPIYTPED